MEYAVVKSLIVAILLGFMIGMQRSLTYLKESERPVAGSRTFALLGLGGYLAAWLESEVPGFLAASTLAVAFLIGVSYYLKVSRAKRWGMTTQVAALVTFFLGMMVRFGYERYAIFAGVLVIVLLEIKPRLQRIERSVSSADVEAVVLLLAMTFVILPILPDEMVGPSDLFNPYKTWLMAVIIAAISFVGYVAIKLLGARHGIFLTGAAGGLVSSTGVTVSLAKMCRIDAEPLYSYAVGIAVACTIMYLRVWLEAFVVDPALSARLAVPYMAAAAAGLGYVRHLYRRAVNQRIVFESSALAKNPLQLSEALKFGLLFGVVYGAIAFVEGRYGDVGVYLVSFLSGITDVDAITLSLSQMASEGRLDPPAAIVGIVTASVTNSLVKLAIVFWLAGARLGWIMARFFLLTLGAMGLGAAWEILGPSLP